MDKKTAAPEIKRKSKKQHEGQLSIFLHPSNSPSLTDELIQTYAKENNYDAQALYVVLYKMFESLENIDLFNLPKTVVKLDYLKEKGLLSKFFNLVHKHIIELKGSYIKNRMLVKA